MVRSRDISGCALESSRELGWLPTVCGLKTAACRGGAGRRSLPVGTGSSTVSQFLLRLWTTFASFLSCVRRKSTYLHLQSKKFYIQLLITKGHLLHLERLLMMNVSQIIETEEDFLTCLHMKIYHPQQNCRGLYGLLPLGIRSRHSAEDPVRLGRDPQACNYTLIDPRVSRKQLALHAYRTPQSLDMLFTIQNLSQKGQLSVNSSSLGYLETMDLPEKALIRFGEYEMLIIQESGEAKASFEVEFETLAVSPSCETCTYGPSKTPVMDTGSCIMNGFPAELRSLGPVESDETLMCSS